MKRNRVTFKGRRFMFGLMMEGRTVTRLQYNIFTLIWQYSTSTFDPASLYTKSWQYFTVYNYLAVLYKDLDSASLYIQ